MHKVLIQKIAYLKFDLKIRDVKEVVVERR